jgi:hypothetical protein
MSTTEVSTTVLARGMDYLPPPDPKAVEQAMLIGDISQMTDAQRIAYYVATCKSLNLNPLTKPFQALKGDDGKMTLYPDKGCAEQLRKLHRVSIKVIGREFLDDLYIVTVRATTPDGREEESQGVVPIAKPKGTWKEYEYKGQQRRRFEPELDSQGHEIMVPLTGAERAAALMRAETKSKRRATLAICGLGLPDWDQDPISPAHPMALDFQPATPHLDAPAEQAKDLATHIADVYGDPVTQSAGEDRAVSIAQIEAAILANQGDIERWYVWAERRFQKPRLAFSAEDYGTFLDAVRAAASLRTSAAHTAEVAPGATSAPASTATPVVSENVSEGTQGPSWGPESPDLFASEEAQEYGE